VLNFPAKLIPCGNVYRCIETPMETPFRFLAAEEFRQLSPPEKDAYLLALAKHLQREPPAADLPAGTDAD